MSLFIIVSFVMLVINMGSFWVIVNWISVIRVDIILMLFKVMVIVFFFKVFWDWVIFLWFIMVFCSKLNYLRCCKIRIINNNLV